MAATSALIVNAKNIGELAPALAECDRIVPDRASGQKKEHVEHYSVTRLLGTLAWATSDFPLTLFKSERPDFLLTCGAREIGIEHTETITENAAKEAYLRAAGHGSESYFRKRMNLVEPRKSSQQLIEEIEADQMGSSWCGDSVEQSWCEAMLHFAREKARSATKTGFRRFTQNWLLMYDNWHAPLLNREVAAERLQRTMEREPIGEVFNRIFILDDLVLVDQERGAAQLSLLRTPSL